MKVPSNFHFSLFSGVRPFGVSLLICGWNEGRPYLFQSDPSVSTIDVLEGFVKVLFEYLIKIEAIKTLQIRVFSLPFGL